MAFDYGSIDLGLKNPFKKEGVITAIRGLLQALIGIYLLIEAVQQVKSDTLSGWVLVVFGMLLLSFGIKALSLGVFATLRYFVGRNPPTSLARNFSKSEASNTQQEANYVAYQANELEEMLVGRKNVTFVEPIGLLARLLHSLFPRLLFMPYPIRNMAQRVFGAWIKTLTAILAYGLIAVVSLFGFAGVLGERMFPIYSVLLALYLAVTWWGAGRFISRAPENKVESLGSGSVVKVIGGSILIPVLLTMGLSFSFGSETNAINVFETWQAFLPEWHATSYIIGIFITATLSCLLLIMQLRARIASVNPVAEVSELRENWQESVHPNEIFINLDNLVMANRRYKEVPNRVYRELDPKLQEQVDNKGGFKGELIQEVQPKVKNLDLGGAFNLARDLSLIAGNLLYVVGGFLIFYLTYAVIDVVQFSTTLSGSLRSILNSEQAGAFLDLLAIALHLLFLGLLSSIFARILSNSAHLFYAEIQFESLLVYFKCEGTFSESKISTGTGIHDSTRSENILVRSSITPWVIVSRLVTTTFAATGMRNLEHPRHVMEMHKADDELLSIKDDVLGFLKDRESIAAITSQRDLGNASQLYQLNQQTRAMPARHLSLPQEEEAAGYLKREEGERKGEQS
ncbi:MAG: hypothetical protein PVI92_16825 [Chromatiales bacterium]|jgi:hypothetical protein